jgi:hypothetical protein
LRAVVDSVGVWGQAWVEAKLSLKNLDPSLLMWDMRRNLNLDPLPRRRSVIQFLYPELPAARRDWFLLVDGSGGVDLCSVDPGFDVDLYVTTDLKTMTEIWLGLLTVRQASDAGRLVLTGDAELSSTMQSWLGLATYAAGKKLAKAS